MLFKLLIALLNIVIWKRYESFLILLAEFSLNPEVEVAFSSDSSSELHVLLFNSHSLSVDATQVSVLEDAHQVGLGGFLKSQEGLSLASKGVIELHADGSHDSLEGGSWQEEVGGLLVSLDLSESNGTWLESILSLFTVVGLLGGSWLNSALGWTGLLGSLHSLLSFGIDFGGSVLSFWHCYLILIKFENYLNLNFENYETFKRLKHSHKILAHLKNTMKMY